MNIKKLLFVLLSILLIFQLAEAEVEFSQKLYKELSKTKNKVPHIKIPDYTKFELENGMKIYFVEDDELPIIEVEGYIKGGRLQETKDIAGISGFMFDMMNTGTKNFNEQELQEYKNLHGVSFGFSVNNDYFKFRGNSLKSDSEYLISMISEILQNPKFDRKYHRRKIMQRYKSLSQNETQEIPLRNEHFYKNLYKDHPYSYSYNTDLLTDTTSSFQPEKLKKYYNRTIAPNSIVMGIYGDFDADKMKELVEAKFSSWKKKEIEYREPELKKPAVDGDIILVHKSDSTQAKIIMGYQFYDYSFKDRIDFLMANRVFGSGGFQSRLMRNLRSEYGYVYAVHSDTDYYKKGGEFTITTGVEPDKTYEVISNIKNEMNKIKNGKEKIKKQELVENINLYNGIFPKYYKTKDEVFSSVLYNLEIRDRGANYLNDFINDYNNITVEKAQQAFEKHTYPAKFFTVIVGNKEDILPSLKKHDLEIKVIND